MKQMRVIRTADWIAEILRTRADAIEAWAIRREFAEIDRALIPPAVREDFAAQIKPTHPALRDLDVAECSGPSTPGRAFWCWRHNTVHPARKEDTDAG